MFSEFPEDDLMNTVATVNDQVANDAHDWIYLSCITSDEVALFNIFDNHERPAIAHSALICSRKAPHNPRA